MKMKLTGRDSLNSWAVSVECSFVKFFTLLPLQISGILFVEFLDRYDTDRKNASLFASLSMVWRCFTGPLIGFLAELFELRSLIIAGSILASLGVVFSFFAEDIITVTVCFGFVYGLGSSMVNNILPQVVKQHFTINISTANGVMFALLGIGSVVIVPLIIFFIDKFGVSGTLLLSGGIMMHAIPISMLLRKPKVHNEAEISEETDDVGRTDTKIVKTMHHDKTLSNIALKTNSNKELSTSIEKQNKYHKAIETFRIFINPSFLAIEFTFSIIVCFYVFMQTTIVDISRDKEIEQSKEQFLLMSLSVFQTIGYISLGWVTDKGFLRATTCMGMEFFLLAVSSLLLVVANGFYSMMVAVTIYGMFWSAMCTLFPALVYEVIEEKHHNMAISSRTVLYGPMSFGVAPMIGYFRGTLGSYDGALYILTAASVMCGILILLLPSIGNCTQKKKPDTRL